MESCVPTHTGRRTKGAQSQKQSLRTRTHKAHSSAQSLQGLQVRPLHAHTVVPMHVRVHLLRTQAQHATRVQKLSEQAQRTSPTHKAQRTSSTHKARTSLRTKPGRTKLRTKPTFVCTRVFFLYNTVRKARKPRKT